MFWTHPFLFILQSNYSVPYPYHLKPELQSSPKQFPYFPSFLILLYLMHVCLIHTPKIKHSISKSPIWKPKIAPQETNTRTSLVLPSLSKLRTPWLLIWHHACPCYQASSVPPNRITLPSFLHQFKLGMWRS